MNLLVTFTYNITLERYHRFGTLSREVALYRQLNEKNVNVGFLTYGGKKDREYSELIRPIKL
ncbi:MAG: hypothetical protein ACFFAO_10985, partial [Candidatus Hermodarchaeota archaeon]